VSTLLHHDFKLSPVNLTRLRSATIAFHSDETKMMHPHLGGRDCGLGARSQAALLAIALAGSIAAVAQRSGQYKYNSPAFDLTDYAREGSVDALCRFDWRVPSAASGDIAISGGIGVC
jgi:hypothetical protein